MKNFLPVAGLAALAALAPVLSSAVETPVSFQNEIMPVISKAGCNMGTCHGNKYGKGGFKLSLRGQDPDLDLIALTRDMFARRVDAFEPDQSLILLKATTQVAHEGGLRFRKESQEYALLRRWIAGGMPNDYGQAPKLERLDVTPAEKVLVAPASEVQLSVAGTFSDGTQRNLTTCVVYETSNPLAHVSHDGLVTSDGPGETTVLVRFQQTQLPVRLAFVPARPGFAWKKTPVSNYVDEQVFNKLRRLRLNPAEPCTDNTFVRRAYFDLLGIPPTADEARAFVADKRRDKRARLVEQLLERPEFADFWALKWSDLLRNEEKALDRKGVQSFYRWIRQSFAENRPLDQFARELIAARGSTYSSPVANFYRAAREPVVRAEAVAQVFLGVRLQCAQCHNHPFDRWTQDDYYNWADLFARVDYKILDNRRRDNLDKHEFVGEQIVFMAHEGEVTNARTGKPATPRFLGAATPSLEGDADRLEALADWIGTPANPLFARAQVNRVWFHLMGRGLVEPLDDFRPTNPPSHPALLDALTKDFVAHKFDVRHLIRLVMNSRTYQLSSEPAAGSDDDEINYSHNVTRRLTAEQLLDALHLATGVPPRFNGYPVGMRAGQLPGVLAVRLREQRASGDDQFLKLFGKPIRLLPTECERSNETTMGQAFQLVSGNTINELLASRENRLSVWLATDKSNAQIIEEIFWTALSRPPTPVETAKAQAHLENTADRRQAFEDIGWGLLNAKEFLLRN